MRKSIIKLIYNENIKIDTYSFDKLEITFYIRALYTLYDPEEAIGFIRELKMKRLLDD
jgi:hypothetical protein